MILMINIHLNIEIGYPLLLLLLNIALITYKGEGHDAISL